MDVMDRPQVALFTEDFSELLPADWVLDIAGCPECKSALVAHGGALRCNRCDLEYPVENEIPSLLTPALSAALSLKIEPVKDFYLHERYDWTSDPRALEYAYHHFRLWETWRQITRTLKSGDVVLDMGCGTGLITRELPRRTDRIIALDLNRWALAHIDGKPRVAKVQGDGEALPIQDESVDLVIATEVIEHLFNPRKAAGEIYRVCKPGATVVGSVPSTSQVWSMRSHLSMTHGGGEPFHASFTRESITALWQEAGFKVEVNPCCMGLNWLWTLKK